MIDNENADVLIHDYVDYDDRDQDQGHIILALSKSIFRDVWL